MNKIIYSGFYGFQNVGDDVFLEVAAWGSEKFLNSKNVHFFGSNLPNLVNPFKQFSKPLFKGHERIQGLIELSNAHYFISAGGSTFSRHKKSSFKQIAEYSKMINPKLKTGAIGVSIGPFKSIQDEKDIIRYLKKMNFLAVRDRRSFDYVSQLNLPYQPIEAFDLAALLPLVYQNIDNNTKIKKNDDLNKIIGVSICPVESITDLSNLKNEKERVVRISSLIKKLSSELNTNTIFRFFIINGNKNFGDENITKEVIIKSGITNYEIIPYQHSVLKAWNSIKECDFMIATRLHAGIMAAYADVPFILNEYHQKCTDFVNDIGQEERFIVGDAEYDFNTIITEIKDVLYNNNYSLKNKTKTQKLALANFKALDFEK